MTTKTTEAEMQRLELRLIKGRATAGDTRSQTVEAKLIEHEQHHMLFERSVMASLVAIRGKVDRIQRLTTWAIGVMVVLAGILVVGVLK